MNHLALVAARREPPFFNLGAPGVDHYLDLRIDGQRLYRIVEEAVGEHHDVICPLTFEAPDSALDLVEALLGGNDHLWQEHHAQEGEIPIYVCPIDYVSTDDAAMRATTEQMAGLHFSLARTQFDEVLPTARAEFAAAAEAIQPAPPPATTGPSSFRRLFKRNR